MCVACRRPTINRRFFCSGSNHVSLQGADRRSVPPGSPKFWPTSPQRSSVTSGGKGQESLASAVHVLHELMEEAPICLKRRHARIYLASLFMRL